MKRFFTLAIVSLMCAVSAIAQQTYDQPVSRDVPCDLANKHGHVIGMGRYCHGSTAYLEAVPDEGYRFAGWSDGSTENPRVFVVEYSLESRFEPLPERLPDSQLTEEGIELYTNHRVLHLEGELAEDFEVITMTGLTIYRGRNHDVELPLPGVYMVRYRQNTYKVAAN